MLSRRFVLVLAVLISIGFAPAWAREAPLPKDPDKFTDFMAGRFSEAVPGGKVKVAGPLRLSLTLPDGGHTVYLDNVWHGCEADRRHCRKSIDAFVVNMTGAMKEETAEIKPGDIRAIVRTVEYAQQASTAAAGKPERAPIVRLVAGGLSMLCVADSPHGIRIVQHAELAKLHLTEDQLIALALKNTAASLPPLAEHTHELKKYGVKFAAGDFYESSRMLLHDQWAEMSKAMGGHLVIAVPTNDVLIYGNGASKDDRIPLVAFANMVIEKAQKPMSPTLYQWTETGWEVVKP